MVCADRDTTETQDPGKGSASHETQQSPDGRSSKVESAIGFQSVSDLCFLVLALPAYYAYDETVIQGEKAFTTHEAWMGSQVKLASGALLAGCRQRVGAICSTV